MITDVMFRKDASYYILAIVLQDFCYMANLDEEMLNGREIPGTETGVLLKKWHDAHRGADPIALDVFQERISENEMLIMRSALAEEMPDLLNVKFNQCIVEIGNPKLQARKMKEEMEFAQRMGDLPKAKKIMGEIISLMREAPVESKSDIDWQKKYQGLDQNYYDLVNMADRIAACVERCARNDNWDEDLLIEHAKKIRLLTSA